jgi:DNA-binding response OmpR family regulator
MPRILVIDDEEGIRHLYRAVLESEGYEVHTAEDGAAGLRLFGERSFDLVITDIVMPEKEGLETIQELLRMRPGLKILAVSGGGIGSPFTYLVLAKQLGAAGALVKPVSMADLQAEVKRLLACT